MSSDTMAAYGRHVAALREQRGLSVADLAENVLVSASMISHIQSGSRRPHHDTARRLDRVLDGSGELLELWQRTTPPARHTPRPQQLPAAPARLAGADRPLAALDAAAAHHAPIVVTGPAGVGKTALTRRWASRQHWDDGVIAVACHGRSAVRQPKPVPEILRELLAPLLHRRRRQLPSTTSLDGQLQLATDLLHDTNALLLLDDVANTEQVRAVLDLPGLTPVLTSRDRLPAFGATHHAQSVEVHPLTSDDADDVLRAVLGDRLNKEQRQVLAVEVDYLPLALLAAAHHVLSHPHRTVDDVLVDLTGPRRLEHLHAAVGGSPTASLRTAITTSANQLSPASYALLGELARNHASTPSPSAPELVELEREHLLHLNEQGWSMPRLVHAWTTADPSAHMSQGPGLRPRP